MEFNNRVYGVAAVKAINSNYNADFTGQPRKLPNGKVYATDKAFKYTIKNYFKTVYHDKEKVFYFKSLNENLNPISLNESYIKHFGDYPKGSGKEKDKIIKTAVAKNLLSCIDVRFFGATFAADTNVSIHGPVQINHGVNIWHEDNIFTEQITAPFSNKANDPEAERGMTTIGRQSKLEEGHYVHHFSINPKNLSDIATLAGESAQKISIEDIDKLKEAMRRGATWYSSASKAGCENELLFWVTLKNNSKIVLPNFTPLIVVQPEKQDGKVVYDFAKVKDVLAKHTADIETIEVYYNKANTIVQNLPDSCVEEDI